MSDIEEVIERLTDFLSGKEGFMAQEDLQRLIEAYRVLEGSLGELIRAERESVAASRERDE